jgi:hypothetical protein
VDLRRARAVTASLPQRQARRSGAWLAALGAGCLALYFRQLALGETFVLRDHLIYSWAKRKVLADGLRAGHLPEWNDLIAFGTQFAASSISGVAYPVDWLVALFPLPFSMDLTVVLHVLLAGVGVAMFSRRLGANDVGAVLAGGAFMACGYVASTAPNQIFAGVAWLPWVAWASAGLARSEGGPARQRAAAVLAAVLGAQLLAGDPAASVTSAVVAVVVTCSLGEGRLRALGWLGASCAVALPLAAATILPGLALLPHTTRTALAASEATSWSLHPWRLLETVWPGFLGNPLDPAYNLAELVANSAQGQLDPGWSSSLYLGAPVLALAWLALRERVPGSRGLLLGAGILTLLALGRYTPVYGAFRALFLPERIVRYPEKHVAGAICIACALAGAALPELPRHDRDARRTFVTLILAQALPLAAAAALQGWLLQRLGVAAALMVPPLELKPIFLQSLRSGWESLMTAAAVFWLLLEARRVRHSQLAASLAVALYLAHACWRTWAITPVAPGNEFSRLPALLRVAARAKTQPGPPPRIYRTPALDAEVLPQAQPGYWHDTLYLDSPGCFGFDALPGFEGWRSPELDALRAQAQGMSLDAFLTLYAVEYVALPSDVRRRLFPAGGRPQGVVAQLDFGHPAEEPEGVAWSLVPVEGARPRAFVAPRWRFASLEGTLASLRDPARTADPGLVVLTGTGDAGGDPREQLSPCAVISYRPEKVVLDCGSPTGGHAVLADENAPGWTATVDGTPSPIANADVLLRAVRVPKGRHRVEFVYRTPFLRLGALISAAAWLGLLAFGVVHRR